MRTVYKNTLLPSKSIRFSIFDILNESKLLIHRDNSEINKK